MEKISKGEVSDMSRLFKWLWWKKPLQSNAIFHRTKAASVGDGVYSWSGLAGGGITDRKRTEVVAESSPTYSSVPLWHSAVLYCLKKQSCICFGGIDLTNMYNVVKPWIKSIHFIKQILLPNLGQLHHNFWIYW